MAGAKLKGYFAQKANERQAAAGKARHGQLVENFPQAVLGKARDQAAAKVGVSGKSVDRAETISATPVVESFPPPDAGKARDQAAAKARTCKGDLDRFGLLDFKSGSPGGVASQTRPFETAGGTQQREVKGYS